MIRFRLILHGTYCFWQGVSESTLSALWFYMKGICMKSINQHLPAIVQDMCVYCIVPRIQTNCYSKWDAVRLFWAYDRFILLQDDFMKFMDDSFHCSLFATEMEYTVKVGPDFVVERKCSAYLPPKLVTAPWKNYHLPRGYDAVSQHLLKLSFLRMLLCSGFTWIPLDSCTVELREEFQFSNYGVHIVFLLSERDIRKGGRRQLCDFSGTVCKRAPSPSRTRRLRFVSGILHALSHYCAGSSLQGLFMKRARSFQHTYVALFFMKQWSYRN